MIIAGAQRLAALSPALKDPDDALLPDFCGQLLRNHLAGEHRLQEESLDIVRGDHLGR